MRNWVIISAVGVITVPLLMGAGFGMVAAGAQAEESSGASGLATSELPPEAEPFIPWIMRSASQCAGLSPAVLAAQLWAESGFSLQEPNVSPAGAEGPAQFMPGTWAQWGRDDDGNGEVSPYDVGDAVMAQGRYMCSQLAQARVSGYGGDHVALALAGYNAGWGRVEQAGGIPAIPETQEYVERVLAKAEEWTQDEPILGEGAGADAVRRAYEYLGTPYSWGGGTPEGPSYGFCDGVNGYGDGRCLAAVTEGFDCSSLVQMAWWSTVQLPRVAADQYGATVGSTVEREDLEPGDLVFWSNSGSQAGIYHVALYYGDGMILHAPRTGREVEIQPMDEAMPPADYYGATRPS